jgi:membrane dipeptidase
MAREAEARGIVLDAAHLNRVAFDQVLAMARHPVVYSHGGSRHLVDAPRNLSDGQARAIAACGGVLGVDFFPGHVARNGGRGTLEDVIAHVEHWAALVGPDHVGFGGDFDGITSTPEGVETAAVYPSLLRRLAERGFGPADLAKIAGGNWVRVLGDRLGVLEVPGGAGNLSSSRETAP